MSELAETWRKINEIVAFKNFTSRGHESALLMVCGALKDLLGRPCLHCILFIYFFQMYVRICIFTNNLARQLDQRLKNRTRPENMDGLDSDAFNAGCQFKLVSDSGCRGPQHIAE